MHTYVPDLSFFFIIGKLDTKELHEGLPCERLYLVDDGCYIFMRWCHDVDLWFNRRTGFAALFYFCDAAEKSSFKS